MKKIISNSLTLVGLFAIATSVQAGAFNQSTLPESIQVPAGNELALVTHAKGNITWECKTTDGKTGWAFAGPRAILSDIQGNAAISYFGPPATWEAFDGSSITGKQLAVSPSKAGSIPMQLVKANASEKDGLLKGVTYIQRINLNGGKAPAEGCNTSKVGHKMVVNYSGDYLFWKAK
ncbi:hypothetical protein THMIRHAS_00200 [Thiosulfatimonas sediminis]|uniref:DUF3455 domain-containing protein n=1 Tax=Thiosulfatimonas sediminis TaxID=2675054 RepID=A0A6F8PRI8_9GAMM|nr:DUF3455 domain-containing protein [Thiosulfatimonas sediminis]BBP44647.1 hypothetical protein THMIRHAS_00200 [Thiosulfatimonas sediminis]